MTRGRLVRLTDAIFRLPVRRPVPTLIACGVLTVFALIGVSRLRPDTSLEAMFAKNDRAAEALVRVLNGFGAAEELLVLVTVPDAPGSPAGRHPQRLLDFAGRFERAIMSSADSASLIDGIFYRADSDTKRFFAEMLVPSGLFYLDDAAFARARRRLTREGMREQLSRNAALLSQPGPAAAAAGKALLRDPLRLHEFLKPKFAAAGSFATPEGEDALLSSDGRALLIRIIGERSPSDLEFCKALIAAATRAAEASNTDPLTVAFGGAYAIATTSERAIRADSIGSVTGAVACLVGLFVVVFRRPVRMLLLAVGPLALGSILGFGAYVVATNSVTLLTAAVGAMMVGMGIDYSVHYLIHYEKRRTAGASAGQAAFETSRDLFGALFAAWLTSVLGFAVVGWSDIPAFGDFALLGSLGLAGVFVVSLTVIPALLVLTDRKDAGPHGNRARLRFSVEPLLGWITRHARACIVCSLTVFAVALGIGLTLPGPLLPLESDLTTMHPRPNPALKTQEEIAQRFGSVPGSLLVHLHADTTEKLVTLTHQVDERLRQSAVSEAGVSGTIGLASFLPSPAAVVRRLAEMEPGEADRVAADFSASLAQSPFDAAAYQTYAGFLRTMLAQRTAPTMADLLRYPRLAQSLLPSAALEPGAAPPTEAITLVSLGHSIDDRTRRAAVINAIRLALADLPGATLTGLPVLGHDAEAGVAREVPRVFALSLALVLGYVLVHFRSPRDAMLSLTTAAFGIVVLLAVMRLAGVRLNMINLVALPLLIGMTVDYGIFLVSLARLGRRHGASRESLREHVASSAQAVLVCAGATLLGFGSLAFTSVPAVQSLGIVVVVGMAAALAGALFLLVPILLAGPVDSDDLRDTENKTGQASLPAPSNAAEGV